MKRKLQIAPRLRSNEIRVRDYGRLPEEIKEGLRSIARMENKSMSWVKEEIIIDYFSLPKPKYIERKKK